MYLMNLNLLVVQTSLFIPHIRVFWHKLSCSLMLKTIHCLNCSLIKYKNCVHTYQHLSRGVTTEGNGKIGAY